MKIVVIINVKKGSAYEKYNGQGFEVLTSTDRFVNIDLNGTETTFTQDEVIVLNENEVKVLKACTNDDCEFDGQNFMTENVKVEGLSKAQLKGFLSQLKQKRLIDVQPDCYYSGYITKKACIFLNL